MTDPLIHLVGRTRMPEFDPEATARDWPPKPPRKPRRRCPDCGTVERTDSCRWCGA